MAQPTGDISAAFVQQFKDTFILVSQQAKSRLDEAVMHEDGIVGTSIDIDRIGVVEAQEGIARHGDTPLIETPFDRSRLFLSDFYWADLIDKGDKQKMITDPTSAIFMAGMAAFNRAKDRKIIAAMLGNRLVVTGQAGSEQTLSNVALPAEQIIVHNSEAMTLAKLIMAKDILMANEAYNEENENDSLHIAVTQRQITNLLNDDQVTSGDYNTVKALVAGAIDTFMGFKFHRLQLLPKSGSTRACVAWVKSGVVRGVGANVETRLTERADKNYSWQPWAHMSIGASRNEEEKVVKVECTE